MWVKPRVPLKRPGAPSDIASTIVFLASDEASYVTGQMIVVDGGSSINMPAIPKAAQ